MSTPTTLTVECHRHGLQEPRPLGRKVVRATIKADVFGRDEASFSLLGPWMDSMRDVAAGDYIVQRDHVGYATYVGRVVTASSTLERAPAGTLTHSPQPVAAVGIWETLKRMQVHVLATASGAYAKRVGTLFPLSEWAPLIATFIGRTPGVDELPGLLLSDMFKSLAYLRLPETLGGGYLADEVPIVFDQESALKYAPQYADIDPINFGRLYPGSLAGDLTARATTLGSLLEHLFLPERTIMEIFPALVDGGTEPLSPLGRVLGRRLVLVYRTKPFRAEALARAPVARGTYIAADFEAQIAPAVAQTAMTGGVAAGALAASVAGAVVGAGQPTQSAASQTKLSQLLVKDKLFAAQTFPPQDIVGLPQRMIINVTRARSDDVRVNATNINATVGGTQTVDSLADVGLPIVLNDQVEKHGLRMTYSHFPWFSPDIASTGPVYYRAVAAQVMQFNMYNHLFDEGSIELMATEVVNVVEDSGSGQTTFRPGLRVRPGDWVRFKLDYVPEYYAYVHALETTIARSPGGELTARTVLQFIRGHFADHDSWMKFPRFPVQE